VFVEALIYIPFLALVWVLMNYVHRFNETDLVVQREARQCTWRYATDGCDGSPPPGCGSGSKSIVEDLELRAVGGGSFEEVDAELPFLTPTLAILHGELVVFDRQATVKRPKGFGAARTLRGHHAMMCNTKTNEWEMYTVYPLTCLFLAPAFCLLTP